MLTNYRNSLLDVACSSVMAVLVVYPLFVIAFCAVTLPLTCRHLLFLKPTALALLRDALLRQQMHPKCPVPCAN